MPAAGADRAVALDDIGISAAGTVSVDLVSVSRLSTAANTFIRFKGLR